MTKGRRADERDDHEGGDGGGDLTAEIITHISHREGEVQVFDQTQGIIFLLLRVANVPEPLVVTLSDNHCTKLDSKVEDTLRTPSRHASPLPP